MVNRKRQVKHFRLLTILMFHSINFLAGVGGNKEREEYILVSR